MKRVLAITAAALMTTAFAGAASADDMMKQGGKAQTNDSGAMDSGAMKSDSGSSAQMKSGVDDGTTASTDGQMSMADLMSAMKGGEATVSAIKSMSDVSSVNVVKTSELQQGDASGGESGSSSMSSAGSSTGKSSASAMGSQSEQPSAVTLDDAVTQNKEQITRLQEAINDNDTLKSKLDDKDVDVSNIVAAQTAADGSLTVFVHDKS